MRNIMLPSLLLTCLPLLCLPGGLKQISSTEPTVRVLLKKQLTGVGQLVITVPKGSVVGCGSDEITVDNNSHWMLKAKQNIVYLKDSDGNSITSGKMLQFIAPDAPPFPSISPKTGIERTYSGALIITSIMDTLRVVNAVPLERYLQGVLPLEIGYSAPAEALKAQAVCARSYTCALLQSNDKTKKPDYDVDDTTRYQLYGGVLVQKDVTDKAVMDTMGQMMTINGAPLLTDYSDDCGGVTAISDNKGFPGGVQDSKGDNTEDYCSHGKYHKWSLSVSLVDIHNALTPADRNKTGSITSVTVIELDKTGRVVNVKVNGDLGSILLKGSAFRACIGYERLRSTMFEIKPTNDNMVLFTGKGNGHGSGLCQEGAIAIAGPPYRFTAEDILAHYFPSVQISGVYSSLRTIKASRHKTLSPSYKRQGSR